MIFMFFPSPFTIKKPASLGLQKSLLTTMKRTVLLLLTSLGAWLATPSGVIMADDFGTGVEVEASHKIGKKLKVGLTGEFRTQDGLNEVERYAVGADASYKLYKEKKSPWEVSAAVGYVYIDRFKPQHLSSSGKNVIAEYWSPRHRGTASLTASYKFLKYWTISLRERYQYTYLTEQFVERTKVLTGKRNDDKVIGGYDKQMLRSRVQLKWERKRSPWEPFVNVELFNDVKYSFAVNQIRYTIGTDYSLTKNNIVGVAYRYKDKSDSDEAAGHLVKFSYTFKF